jgi:NADH-quinone oxidoreductase subunit N
LNAPLIWIAIPALAALALFPFRKWRRVSTLIGISLCLLLAWLAWQVPIRQAIYLGPWRALSALTVEDTLSVLGRQLVLSDAMRPVLIIIYLTIAVWMGGAFAAKAGSFFVPLGLLIAATLTATLAVRPFLYASLLIELAALVSVPLLSPPGQKIGRGITRFLTYQTLGMPFILFAGWILGQETVFPLNFFQNAELARAAWMAALGLALLAGIFPFHTWISMIAEESHPYAAGFILFTVPTVISIFMLPFLVEYIIPLAPEFAFVSMRFIGGLMVLIGSTWCAFQSHLGRMLGFGVISEIGFMILALSLGPGGEAGQGSFFLPEAMPIFFSQILVRGAAMALWALSLSILYNKRRPGRGNLEFRQVQGAARQAPLAALGLVLAHFTLAGLPLLAGFPVRLALWQSLASLSLPTAMLVLVSSMGMVIAGTRTLAVLVTGENLAGWKFSESFIQKLLLVTGWIMLVLIGLFPQWFLGPISQAASAFIFVP